MFECNKCKNKNKNKNPLFAFSENATPTNNTNKNFATIAKVQFHKKKLSLTNKEV